MSSAPPPPYPSDPQKGGAPQPYQPAPAGGYPSQQGQPGQYPPGQGQYPPGQAPTPPQYAQPGQPGYAQTSTVVVQQPVVTIAQQYRESPVQTTCPHCRAQIVTGVHYETGSLTWIICVVLCLVGCNLGCCFIPFCIDGCKDGIHTCPNCRQTIARFSRL